MRALGMRVPVVMASMALVLALLFGGQFFYNRQAVDQPLLKMYHNVAAVKSVAVQTTQSGLDIHVKLGLVPNLRQTYMKLEKQTAGILGGSHYTIDLGDTRTPALIDDYYKLDPILMEGLATGRFVQMTQRAEALGKQVGLTRTQVIPDQHALYVELVQGKHYLYTIIPRGGTAVAQANTGGGSS